MHLRIVVPLPVVTAPGPRILSGRDFASNPMTGATQNRQESSIGVFFLLFSCRCSSTHSRRYHRLRDLDVLYKVHDSNVKAAFLWA
jgi:hypothetical protein